MGSVECEGWRVKLGGVSSDVVAKGEGRREEGGVWSVKGEIRRAKSGGRKVRRTGER